MNKGQLALLMQGPSDTQFITGAADVAGSLTCPTRPSPHRPNVSNDGTEASLYDLFVDEQLLSHLSA